MRGVKYDATTKQAMVALVKNFGLTGAKNELDSVGLHVTLPTLGKFAGEAGVVLRKGRPGQDGNVVKVKVKKSKVAKKSGKKAVKVTGRGRRFTEEQKASFVEMIKTHGLTGTQTELASKGTEVTIVTLWKLAKTAGIKLQKGRPKTAVEATEPVAA
jgi:hypothetical protein